MTRVLHVLDHSLPLHSGYTFRTRAILRAQEADGLEIRSLTGLRQLSWGGAEANSAGLFEAAPLAVMILFPYPVVYSEACGPLASQNLLVMNFEIPRFPAMARRLDRSVKIPRSSLTNARQLTEVMAW